jgi:transcriptional regulator of acetoin/glycerol metabolism
VISTSSVSLLPLVQSGAFSDDLYYRLNTIWVDLRPF